MTTIAVFGATGRTGGKVTQRALAQGYQVRALVRTPSKLTISHPNLTVIQGDLADYAKAEETIRGTEAVLLVVGFAPMSKAQPNARQTMTDNVLKAMQATGVKRLIRLTNFMGALDGEDQVGMSGKLMKRMMGKTIADETASVELVRQSGEDWTIVRNAVINMSAGKGTTAVAPYGKGSNSCTADDLAGFILNELKTGTYVRQAPFVHG